MYPMNELEHQNDQTSYLAELINSYNANVANPSLRQQYERQIEEFLPQKEVDCSRILEETLQLMMRKSLHEALDILNSPEVKNAFTGDHTATPERFIGAVWDNPDLIDISNIFHTLHHTVAHIAAYPFSTEDKYVQFPQYPFNKLHLDPDSPLGITAANLGHDIIHLPIFLWDIHTLTSVIKDHQKNPNLYSTVKHSLPLAAETFRQIYEGSVLMFQAFLNAAGEPIPLTIININHLIDITVAEGAIKAMLDKSGLHRSVKQLSFKGKIFTDFNSTWNTSLTIEDHIQPDMNLTGYTDQLHMLFYQLFKNSLSILREQKENDDMKISIAAGNCRCTRHDRSHSILAVRFRDNGPGLDITKILRAEQKLLLRKYASGDNLSPDEQRITDQWTCLDLTLAEVISLIFQRRVSGRYGKTPHSGIGLSIAQQIISEHHGSIWATNISGENGAEFLLLFDPIGTLRDTFPDLYPQSHPSKVPADLLDQIEYQLDQIP